MMNTLIAMALSGSAVTALWLALLPLTETRFSPRWHEGVLKLALALFLLPLGAVLTAVTQIISPLLAPAPAVYSGTAGTAAQAVGALAEAVPVLTAPTQGAGDALITLPVEGLALLALLWGVGAVALLLYKGLGYLRFRRRVLAISTLDLTPATAALVTQCARQVGCGRRVRVRVAPLAGVPFAMGLLRPVVFLPVQGLDREELRYVLLHELTHIKRGDLWVRALCVIAQALHWYDPLIYLLTRRLQDMGEQVCDARATGDMSRRERYEYGKVLLRAAVPQGLGDWAAPLSAKKTVQGRLTRMFCGKPMTGRQRLAATLAAVLLLTCGCATALTACSGLVGAAPPSVTLGQLSPPEDTAPAEETAPAEDSPTSSAAPVTDAAQTPSADEGAPSAPAENPDPEPAPATLLTAATQSVTAEPAPAATPTPQPETNVEPQETAPAEVAEIDISAQLAAVTLTYPYPTLTELLSIPAVAAWRRDEPSDLTAAQGTQGEDGYIRQSDFLEVGVNTPAERQACAQVMSALPNGYLIPLYDGDGSPIGWFRVQGGRSVS